MANAFHELNDPQIQKKRFAEDLAKKKILNKEPIPLDEEFMQCLEGGDAASQWNRIGSRKTLHGID